MTTITPPRQSLLQAGPVFLAFLAMGFADAAGPFVSLAKQDFHLSNFTAQLIAFAGFIMFGIVSVPMGVYQDRKGKKFILILGLAVMLAGVLIPTLLGLSSFPTFLLTVLLLGAGATTLQVAGNPMMRDVSEEGKYLAESLAGAVREGHRIAVGTADSRDRGAGLRPQLAGRVPGLQRGDSDRAARRRRPSARRRPPPRGPARQRSARAWRS